MKLWTTGNRLSRSFKKGEVVKGTRASLNEFLEKLLSLNHESRCCCPRTRSKPLVTMFSAETYGVWTIIPMIVRIPVFLCIRSKCSQHPES